MSERPMLSSIVTVSRQFQRSVRVDVDFGRDDALDGYVLQPSARAALESVARQVAQTRQRAFTLTGPYGGGKSSLALALASLAGGTRALRTRARKVLGLGARDQVNRVFGGQTPWLVVAVVGQRADVKEELGRSIDVSGAPKKLGRPGKGGRDVVQDLERIAGSGKYGGVLVLIDELGKLLEHAASAGEDIYFYQQLAEAASRAEGQLVVVGILHQAFEQYASRLGRTTREEWAKVQGRFHDIPLLAGSDETIALIGQAIEVTGDQNIRQFSQPSANATADVIKTRRPSTPSSLADALVQCWPLHPVTAALLGPSSKRKFSQNERSIFGFLASAEPLGFREFLSAATESDLYRPAMYWDYLAANFEAAVLSSADGHRWSLGAEAAERAAAKFSPLHVELVKTVALIELFRNGSGLAAEEGLLVHCVDASARNVRDALQQLGQASILIFRRHLQAWGVYAGSDFDIEAAVQSRVAERVDPDLKKIAALADLHPITARRLYAETGTMRWFSRVLSRPSEVEKVLQATEAGSAVGAFVLLVPTNSDDAAGIDAVAMELSHKRGMWRHVFGVPKQALRISDLARELEALQFVRTNEKRVHDDPVARREIDARTTMLSGTLAETLRDAFLEAEWFWKGKPQEQVTRSTGLSPLATKVAGGLYSKTPNLFSELVNRDELSSSAAKAQRELMHRMLTHGGEERLGFDGFPAEAGLYFSLIQPAGLHRKVDGHWRMTSPTREGRGESLLTLWTRTHELLDEAEDGVTLEELYAVWRAEPFGLRRGVMPILAAAFVLADRARIALYVDKVFTPELTPADLDEWLQDPSRIGLRRVRLATNATKMLRALAAALQERLGKHVVAEPLDTARAMVSLVFALPPWTQKTLTVSEDARRLRDLLLKASDPHKVLFTDLPTILGVPADQHLVERIAEIAEELQTVFPRTLGDVEQRMLSALDHAGSLGRLRTRASVVKGISGNFRLDAFAGRLAVYEGSLADQEGLVMLALNKPTPSWVDNDIDAAVLQLCSWAIDFRRVEALAAVRDRAPTRRAFAVVFGSAGDHGGKTVSGTVDVSAADSPEIERVVSDFLATCVHRQTKREVILAALAEAGARLFEEQ
jgi:hypothetical protein